MTAAVYGIGNVLIGDDAIGPTVARTFEASWSLDPAVVVEDLGTPSLDLTDHVIDHDTVIFVDAVTDDHAPGTILIYSREEIIASAPIMRVGPHDPALRDALLTLELFGQGPADIILIGIVAQQLAGGLSENVRAAIPRACATIASELQQRGYSASPASDPARPDLWWE